MGWSQSHIIYRLVAGSRKIGRFCGVLNPLLTTDKSNFYIALPVAKKNLTLSRLKWHLSSKNQQYEYNYRYQGERNSGF